MNADGVRVNLPAMSFRALMAPVFVLACGHVSVASPVEAGTSSPERKGRRVDIGDRSLFLDCGGSGSPTVILEAGGGADGTAWANIAPDLQRLTTVCAYDRAGTGLSSGAPRPHTLQQMVDELGALLERAQLHGPYVMVGHSLGGLLVRLYASQHRSSVCGMVLVDPTTEQQDARMWALMPADLMRQFEHNLSQSPEGLDYASFVAGMAQLRSANRSLGESPLVVLTALGEQTAAEPGVSAEVGAQIAREWLTMHEEVSRLSSNSAHVLIHHSGHDVAKDAPGVIIAAIEEVLASARSKRRLAAEKLHRAAKRGEP